MLVRYKSYAFDLSKPLDLSIALHDGLPQVNCYGAPPFRTEPVRNAAFTGSIREGGLLNYKNIFLNPHGNGTHTECIGHIADLGVSMQFLPSSFHFHAHLITLAPEQDKNGDFVITAGQIMEALHEIPEALIIRTLPNTHDKMTKDYNGTNPPYLHWEAAQWIAAQHILHLLIDLPSIDREEDGGKLLAHRAFFGFPENPRLSATITELIFVAESVPDGTYLLNLQTPAMDTDAVPSRPVLFPLAS